MKNDINRQFRLKTRPTGRIEKSNFDFVEESVPEPGPGEALVRVLYLSLDPTNRIWMSDMDQYMPPVGIGEVMRGGGVGVVVKSNSARYKEGDHVSGLTAYFGLLDLGRPKPGETVVVSAAAGAVGSVVGQIAKIKGCRAVGIAGGPDKCRHIVEDLGFDAAVDYKRPDWREQLAAATPDGIDVNFENVGGEIMEAVMARMNLFSRMPLCGMISGYNTGEPMRGDFSPILMRRIELRGFIVIDFMDKFAEGAMQLAQWVVEGKLKHRETIVDGLENAPVAVNKLFDGGNIGKLVVKL